MSRERTGTVETLRRADGTVYYRAKVRLADGSRKSVDIPAEDCVRPEDRAGFARDVQGREDEKHTLLRAKERRVAHAVGALVSLGDAKGDTVDAFAARVFEDREADGIVSVGRDRRLWRARVSPRIGSKAIARITRDQIEDFRNYLDEEVRQRIVGTKDDGLAGKSALNIWTLVRTVMWEAYAARDRDMRVRTDDPTSGLEAPKKTRARAKTFVWPSEFAKLMTSTVPLEWRELYAVAAYLYVRPGELRALTFADVDVDAGVVRISKAYDEEGGRVKPTKTRAGVRDVPIEPSLLPLLVAMKTRADKDASKPVAPLLATVQESKRATIFREHLKVAGVTRTELFADDNTNIMVNFRSLRDSGITWLALAGVPIERVQRRAGHEKIETTVGYMKVAEDIGNRYGLPFASLPFAEQTGPIMGLTSGQSATKTRETSEKTGSDCRTRTGLEGLLARTGAREPGEYGDANRRESTSANHSDHRSDRSQIGAADALAGALAAAAKAEQWDTVKILAEELRARRLASEGVSDLSKARSR